MHARALPLAAVAGSLAALAPASAAPPAHPPALFAKLFVDGVTWKFPFVRSDADGKKLTSRHGTLTCRVDGVSHDTAGWASRVDCTPSVDIPGLVFGPSSAYTATDDALFDEGHIVLDAHPKALTTKPDPDGTWRQIRAVDTAWCAKTTSLSEGHEVSYGSVICFRNGAPVGGRSFFSEVGGATSKEVVWGEQL